ncbi:xanthine dehydrogenase family protein subunit M [Caenispirillum bisanense]|uniref:FAD binding domain-containing protein n=1 Tax=Caenispirillum bisanense TaxID=414052 RepID=UPI0031DAE81B
MAKYVRVHSVDQALECLAERPFRIIAGGTDVYPALGEAVIGDDILDISGLRDLRGIRCDNGPAGDSWRIGALTTWTDVLRADLPPWFDGLKLAAREVGSVQIQNAGTVAGNICNASPAADGTAALLALDARVEISGPAGLRVQPLADFVTGVRRTTLVPGELVTAIIVPDGGGDGASDFLKLGARHYLVISIAMVSVVLRRRDGVITGAGIAVGSCSPVARRLDGLERRLTGRPPQGLAALVEEADAAPLSPIDDVRATAAYRREAALTLVRRALSRCEEALR